MMMMMVSYTLFITTILLTTRLPSSSSQLIDPSSSFSISGAIIRHDLDLPARVLHIREHYSSEQRRARVQYENESRSKEDFFYDAHTQDYLVYSHRDRECHISSGSPEILYDSMALRGGIFAPVIDNLINKRDENRHIVGLAARLLVLISQEDLSNFRLKYGPKKIKNLTSVEYKLTKSVNIDELNTDDLEITLLYDNTKLSAEQENDKSFMASQLPLRLIVRLTKKYVGFKIDYYKIENLISSMNPETGRMSPSELEAIQYDLFTYPTSYNCSSLLQSPSMNLIDHSDQTKLKISSIIQSELPFLAKSFKHQIYLDGSQSFVQIDRQTARPHHNTVRSVSDILDFRYNRRFSIVDKEVLVEASSSLKDPVKDLPNERIKHCSVAQLMPDRSQSIGSIEQVDDFASFSLILFGTREFHYMGLGKIRGVKVKIYEAYSNRMPYWLNMPVLYKTPDSQLRYRFDGSSMREGATDQASLQLNTILYVKADHDEETEVTPLAIEVFNMKVDRASSSRKVLVASWHKFNHDNLILPSLLFDISQICSTQRSNFFEISMHMESVENGRDPETCDNFGASDWLSNSLERNQALLTAFRNNFALQTPMIYDFKSKLVALSKYKFFPPRRDLIQVDFKLARQTKDLYELTFMGNAQLLSDDKLNQKELIFVQTITECLWLIEENQLKTPAYLYFTEASDSFCLIITDISYSFMHTTMESKSITLTQNGLGELYQINKISSPQSIPKMEQLEEERLFLESVNNIVIKLSPIEPPSGGNLKMISSFRIRNVNLKDHNYQSADETEESASIPNGQASRYSNYKLSPSSYLNRRLESSERAYLTLAQCQAACLTDPTCRSYSYCLIAIKQSECILSRFNIDEGQFKTKDSKVSTLQSLFGTYGMDLGIPSSSSSSSRPAKLKLEQPKLKMTVELLLDKRCELFSKVYLDLFLPNGPLSTTLKGHSIIPVQSEEQCAQLCFERSLATIELSYTLNEEIDELIAVSDLSNAETIDSIHREFQQELTRFCRNFLYLKGSSIIQYNELRKKIMAKFSASSTINSYCILEGSDSGQLVLDPHSELDKILIEFESFKFDFKQLYERHQNFRFVESPLEAHEYRAFELITLADASESLSKNLTNYETIRESIIEHGKNFQSVYLFHTPEAINCAILCFTKASLLWTNCKSFDIMSSSEGAGQNPSSSTCYINSVSLRDETNNRMYNVSYSATNKLVKYWHFEPRFDPSDFRQVSQQQPTYHHRHTRQSRYVTRNVYNANESMSRKYMTFILTISGLLSGLLVGIIASHRIIAIQDGRQRRRLAADGRNESCIDLSVMNGKNSTTYKGKPFISNPIPINVMPVRNLKMFNGSNFSNLNNEFSAGPSWSFTNTSCQFDQLTTETYPLPKIGEDGEEIYKLER